jgi:hypothetical protein
VEGKDIDPATGATVPDLDLSGCFPTGSLEALREIGGAPNMRRVALAFPIMKERRLDRDGQPGTHRPKNPSGGLECQLRQVTVLNVRDMRLRDAGAQGEHSL